MKILEIISFAKKHLNEYFRSFVKTIAHPLEQFPPMKTHSATDPTTKASSQTQPPIMAFALISIFLGSILNSLVPSGKYSGDIVTKVFVVLNLWFCFSLFAHLLCRALCGRAEFEQTFLVSLHVFAVLFVVSGFANLVGGVFARHPHVATYLISTGKLGDSIANNPFYIYFFVHFISFNIYLPVSIRRIHGFGHIRPLMVGIALSLFWVLFAAIFSSDIGIRHKKFYHEKSAEVGLRLSCAPVKALFGGFQR